MVTTRVPCTGTRPNGSRIVCVEPKIYKLKVFSPVTKNITQIDLMYLYVTRQPGIGRCLIQLLPNQIGQKCGTGMIRFWAFVKMTPMSYVHFTVPFSFSQDPIISNKITATSCLCWIAHDGHWSISSQNPMICSLCGVSFPSHKVNLIIQKLDRWMKKQRTRVKQYQPNRAGNTEMMHLPQLFWLLQDLSRTAHIVSWLIGPP